MPHYIGLVRFVLAAQHRVNVAGEICLTAAEAAFVRALDFTTAVEGNWRLPEWPTALMRGYPELGRLVDYAKHRAERASARAVAPPEATPSPRLSPDEEGQRMLSLATEDERRILASVLRRPEGPFKKRPLHHRLHRMPAARLNPALESLLAKGWVTTVEGSYVLSASVRAALIAAGLGGSPAGRQRATHETEPAGSTRRRPLVRHVTKAGDICYLPRTRNGRRVLPPRGTSAWGRSMRARRGGLAVQRRYRAEGRHPTAAATRARLERQQRQTTSGESVRDDRS